MKPIFSVVMPAYNAERYAGEAIESVLAQTLPDWELLVRNNCSTDWTFYHET
jgi:teichuronic acid biosynthesis glycosyltransferase TuaG